MFLGYQAKTSKIPIQVYKILSFCASVGKRKCKTFEVNANYEPKIFLFSFVDVYHATCQIVST